MPVTLQLAMKLPRLRHLTTAQAAARLGLPLADVEAACRMLALPMAHEQGPRLQALDDADRAAAPANLPMKMQQRYEKRKR